MKKIKMAGLALVLMATMVVMGESSADAHPGTQNHASATSFFVCGNTKQLLTTVTLSAPVYFDENIVIYTCIGHMHNPNVVCEWEAIQWPGTITGPHGTSCSPF